MRVRRVSIESQERVQRESEKGPEGLEWVKSEFTEGQERVKREPERV